MSCNRGLGRDRHGLKHQGATGAMAREGLGGLYRRFNRAAIGLSGIFPTNTVMGVNSSVHCNFDNFYSF